LHRPIETAPFIRTYPVWVVSLFKPRACLPRYATMCFDSGYALNVHSDGLVCSSRTFATLQEMGPQGEP